MADVKTKSNIENVGSERVRVWKSLTLNSGDVLFTGLLEVWAVIISDPTKWSTPSWVVGTGVNRGKITFTLTGAFTGRVVVIGR